MKGVTIIIPAAGASSRMGGRDKLLEDVTGVPLLRRQVLRALETGCDVIVALPPDGDARLGTLAGLDVRGVSVRDAKEGMAASLRAGEAAAAPGDALMILLPDMPDLTTEDLDTLLRAQAVTPGRVFRGSGSGGVPGHPVILPARLRARVGTLSGDVGARDVIADEDVGLVPLPGRNAMTDLDTPEAWAVWRAARE